MNPSRPTTPLPDPTIYMSEGWHCLHIYYQVDRRELGKLSSEQRAAGREELRKILDPSRPNAPKRLQASVISGHRADLGLMILDPDPILIDQVHQSVQVSPLGTALVPTYSFVSITEVSEYVPTVEQYEEKLRQEGTSPDALQAKVAAYRQRLPVMNQQRLYPDIPPTFPVSCFYPMNKSRHPQANWFMEPPSLRSSLMAEHATSGIKFAGKVSQLITASAGFDDWEWGVTLWARAPEYIKDIVYTMRFDEASAKYAEFGPFYIGYPMTALDVIAHLRL